MSHSETGFKLSARISIDPHKGIRGTIHWLELGESIRLVDLTFPETVIQHQRWALAGELSALYHKYSSLHARMPDGNAIRHLELSGQVVTGPLFHSAGKHS